MLPTNARSLPKGSVTVSGYLNQLLDQFEQLYHMHVADRERLEQELDEISK
jgi:hypothetical protein